MPLDEGVTRPTVSTTNLLLHSPPPPHTGIYTVTVLYLLVSPPQHTHLAYLLCNCQFSWFESYHIHKAICPWPEDSSRKVLEQLSS